MFCSIVIPTVGRTSLAGAVQSVLGQSMLPGQYEVIVVNDSGSPLPWAEWQDCAQVRVIATNCLERSVARNTGAAVAAGEYLLFLDDDDWLLPDALASFQKVIREREHPFVYGGAILMASPTVVLYPIHPKMDGNCFTQVVAGEWIPSGAFIIRRKSFFNAGGYRPFLSVYEDFDFSRRLALSEDFAFIPEPVLCILRGEHWNTTTAYVYPDEHGKKISLLAREQILNSPLAFRRFLGSANSSYWLGCFVRAYLSSGVFNLLERRFGMALLRLVTSLVAFALSGVHVASVSFWRGLQKPHNSSNREVDHGPAAGRQPVFSE